MSEQAVIQDKVKRVVWVISDGIPGHYNQSKGVLLALEYLYDVDQHWVELKLKNILPKQIIALLLNYGLLPQGLFPLVYKGQLPIQKPDIVVGAGGRASFAVAWLGKIYQAKTIFTGSLRQLKSQLFDAVLHLEESPDPHILTLPTSPNAMTQQALQLAVQAWQDSHKATTSQFWAMLIGGDGAGARYQAEDWREMAQQMNQLASAHNIEWLVTTSRRSGALADQVLKQDLNEKQLADAVWWSEQPRPVTSAYLGLSNVVFCTIDSMSMIMESVSAMRPVVVIQPKDFQPDSRFITAVKRLAERHLILISRIDNLTEQAQQLAQLTPLNREPSQLLAEKLQPYLQNTSK